jgi:D-alanyl-D-alanine carboxypeptidase/D-alanyl-D-alanine-endopeptidase (penicillin-binding protein 4)
MDLESFFYLHFRLFYTHREDYDLKNIAVLCISCFLLWSCATSNFQADFYHNEYGNAHYANRNKAIKNFRAQVDERINIPELQPANLGIYIENSQTREVLYARNAHKLFMPASNMKLFTTGAALALLGSDYVYRTGLYTDGIIQNDTLKGNLYLKGSGDPSISGRHNNGDTFQMFREFADALHDQGITFVQGSIIGDDNVFDDQALGYGWAWDDESYYYSAQISGLSFNDNCVDLHISPGAEIGESARCWAFPATEYIKLQNNLKTVTADSSLSFDFQRYPGTNTVNIFGKIPLDADTVLTWVTVDNPTLYTLQIFKNYLTQQGIEVQNIQDVDDLTSNPLDYSNFLLLTEHLSVPLSEIIRTVNKESQNFYAECLQRTLGAEFAKEGSAWSGIEVEKNWFSQIGINPDHIFIVDGSGLSRHNLVTPFQIATLLRTMKYHSTAEIFFNSLPVGGVDGTLKRRLQGANAVGHVFAKTGYVGYVRTLSGYVQARNGTDYIFSILVNHYSVPTSAINDLQDAVLTLLYNLFY